MNTEIHGSKKNIRLLIVIVYLLIAMPIHFRFMNSDRGGTIQDLIVKFIVFGIIITLELIEYLLKYPGNERKALVRMLFAGRSITVLAAFLYGTATGGGIEPFFFAFIPLLAFYSSFAMALPISIIFTLGITGSNIWLDIIHFQDKEISTYFVAVLVFQRIITIVIFYLFAYFWKADIKKTRENELLLDRVNRSEEDLRKYATEVAKTSVLEERTRIAREMHDSVGHGLTAIQMQLRKALAFTSIDIEEAALSIDAALEVASSSLQDTRAVLNDLRNEQMRYSFKDEVVPVIETLKQAGIEVQLEVSGREDNFNYAVLIALFRFIQEGSTNILKHAKASTVRIKIEFTADAADLTIEDDGRGFDTSRVSDDSGMGLHGLKERFELIRGSLSVESEIGKGCRLTARAPKDPVKLIGELNG